LLATAPAWRKFFVLRLRIFVETQVTLFYNLEGASLKVLIFDFETDGPDAKVCRFTELGGILCHVNEDDKLAVIGSDFMGDRQAFNMLAYEPDYPPLTDKIKKITGLTDEQLKFDGKPRKEVLEKFLPLVQRADILISHKTSFDVTILEETAKLFGLTELVEEIKKKEIICSLTNMEWPEHFTCHKLGHMAWELGIDVKAADLHRASSDCELLLKMINLKNFRDILAYARKPFVYMKADILGPWQGKGGDGGVQKGISQGLGFSYESVKGMDYPKWPKTWVGRFKVDKADEVARAAAQSESPFRVSTIQGLS
jgi:DNA polymerase III epsilon subunit-like protein